MSARGLGITTADMEVSRLVFVSVKDAKPRRKVAVPVPDTATWEQFLQQSGEQVTQLSELQDIDELHVVEAKPPPPVVAATVVQGNGSASSVMDARASSGHAASTSSANGPSAAGGANAAVPLPHGLYRPVVAAERGVVAADATEIEARDDGEGDDGDGGEAKYARRPRSVRRSLQRAFPALFPASLPVTARDVKEGGETGKRGGRRRRRSRSFPDVRGVLVALVALAFLGFLALLYARVSPRLP